MSKRLSPRPGRAMSRDLRPGWRSGDLAEPIAKVRGPSCTSAPPVRALLEVLLALPGPLKSGVGGVRGRLSVCGPLDVSLSSLVARAGILRACVLYRSYSWFNVLLSPTEILNF